MNGRHHSSVDGERKEQGGGVQGTKILGCTKTQKATDTTHYCQQQMRADKGLVSITSIFSQGGYNSSSNSTATTITTSI